ncbi:MAG: hypothetical protein OXI38_11180 [Bacteroidota bacterium]|nr:hypothetical protein [Bacteroidota bacterium]
MVSDAGSSRVLLVEGVTDRHAIRHIWTKVTREDPSFSIKDKGGIENLLQDLGAEIRVSGLKVLGIILDANNNPTCRWKAIADRLMAAGIQVPNVIDPLGTIVNGPPLIGVWLMPDNDSAGELEHFIESLIPDTDVVWPLAAKYVDAIPENSREFRAHKELRAKIYAWLAVRKDPRKPGEAIGAGDLNTDAPLAKSLIAWLQRLFG